MPNLGAGERVAFGDVDLTLDDVDPGHELSHCVLDLDARVHLDEVVTTLAINQELDGAGVAVADRLGQAHRLVAQALAQRLRQAGAGATSTTF